MNNKVIRLVNTCHGTHKSLYFVFIVQAYAVCNAAKAKANHKS